MKHSLQLKLSQHLTLTPQLQQSIRLLQLSTLELQLRAMPEATPRRDRAIELVTKHLDVLAARDFNRLKRLLGVD